MGGTARRTLARRGPERDCGLRIIPLRWVTRSASATVSVEQLPPGPHRRTTRLDALRQQRLQPGPL